jgi:hypothetical protein
MPVKRLKFAVIKNTNFWDVTPCSPIEIEAHSQGTYWLHLQGRRVSKKQAARRDAGGMFLRIIGEF